MHALYGAEQCNDVQNKDKLAAGDGAPLNMRSNTASHFKVLLRMFSELQFDCTCAPLRHCHHLLGFPGHLQQPAPGLRPPSQLLRQVSACMFYPEMLQCKIHIPLLTASMITNRKHNAKHMFNVGHAEILAHSQMAIMPSCDSTGCTATHSSTTITWLQCHMQM